MTMFDDILETAKKETWSRKKVRTAMYAANDPELWSRRDEMLQALGLPTTDQAAAQKAEKAAAEKAAAEKTAAEAVIETAQKTAENQRIAKLREQSEHEQREAKETDLQEYHQSERAELDDIEPHWPTYHRVLELVGDCREYKDACHYRDAGDIMAFKAAPDELFHIAEIVLLDTRSVAADILIKTHGAMTDKQAKLVALILSKLAAKNGMTGNKPLGPSTSHRQESLNAETEQFVVSLDRNDSRPVMVRFAATKKTGRPYLAKLSSGFKREFAKAKKFTNSRKCFYLDNLRVGDVIEFRGFNWSGEAYKGGVEYAVIANDLIWFISRFAAKGLLEGDNLFYVDQITEVYKLNPNAELPEGVKERQIHDFAAWYHDDDGNILASKE